MYRLPDLWCLHFYGYEAVLELDGVAFPIHPQSVSVIAPNTKMVYRYRGLSEHCYCHFRLSKSASTVSIPAVQNLGRAAVPLAQRLRESAHRIESPMAQIQATVWDILWSLTAEDSGVPRSKDRHPTVDQAVLIIENRLAEPISIVDLANEVNVSYGYLSRLFRAYLGDSVVGYIRRRRCERAEHMLRCSTMPIKSIAASVGVPDLHQFSRMIQRNLGSSPRSIRLGQINRHEA
jgi:AraC-like DNA-binding protein